MVKTLLEHGANIEAKDINENTPLHIAAYNNRLEIAKLLIEKGAIIDSKNNHGATLLHHAAQEGHLDMATFLLECHVNPNTESNFGLTPLFLATKKKHIAVMKKLVEFGADVQLVVQRSKAHNFAEMLETQEAGFEIKDQECIIA